MEKIKGKLFIKKGAYWIAEDSQKSGIKRLFRSNKDIISIKGPIKNGEIILDNAYYDIENHKIIVEIDLNDK